MDLVGIINGLNLFEQGLVIMQGNGVVSFISEPALKLLGIENKDLLVGLNLFEICNILRPGDENNEIKIPDLASFLKIFKIQDNYYTGNFEVLNNSIKKNSIAAKMSVAKMQNDYVFYLVIKDNRAYDEILSKQMEFISTASHEMRTPVASIEGYLGLAINPTTATIDERARKYLESAHKASQHLGQLFKDLLDVTKSDDGRERIKMEPIILGDFIAEIMSDLSMIGTMKGININLVGDNQKLKQLIYVMTDKVILKEILINLVENAVKYNQANGKVEIFLSAEENIATINVKDTGIGIAREDIGKIFQKFYRVDNSDTREIGGTGLGLYLVKERVEAMNGKVEVESILGQGSNFMVKLPRLSSTEFSRQKLIWENNNANWS